MELYQLQYFLMTAKYENVSKAAQELHASQPAVSRAVHALEEELGTELLKRTGKHVKLTYEGQMFRERLLPVLDELMVIKRETIETERRARETVHLNMLSMAILMPGLIKKFRKENPNTYFRLKERKEGTQWDLCIRSSLPDITYNRAQKLLDERVFLAVNKNSGLAQKEIISLEELKKEPFIILREGTNMRAMSDKYFHEVGFVPKEAYECDTLYTLRNMVREGLGVAIWPEVSWGDERCRDYYNVCLKEIDMPKMVRSLYLIYPKDRKLSAAAEKFANFLIDYFEAWRD